MGTRLKPEDSTVRRAARIRLSAIRASLPLGRWRVVREGWYKHTDGFVCYYFAGHTAAGQTERGQPQQQQQPPVHDDRAQYYLYNIIFAAAVPTYIYVHKSFDYNPCAARCRPGPSAGIRLNIFSFFFLYRYRVRYRIVKSRVLKRNKPVRNFCKIYRALWVPRKGHPRTILSFKSVKGPSSNGFHKRFRALRNGRVSYRLPPGSFRLPSIRVFNVALSTRKTVFILWRDHGNIYKYIHLASGILKNIDVAETRLLCSPPGTAHVSLVRFERLKTRRRNST